ncbi:hypothetical protein A0H81_08088 [Grifola frondosa]|uniref:Uncharacterized protein n=1 Tax=Grifola frondosa TaxID=5627 RepID=A0A1C7M4G0_GRIFR|nr:hypothetical protein A0H81_08088 [Grifola frondosa]
MYMLSSRNAFTAIPAKAQKERDIYDPLVSSLNRKTKHKSRCPGIVFRNTSAYPDHDKKLGSHKPDLCGYAEEHLQFVQVSESHATAHTDLGYAALFIEVKPCPELDFFRDPPKDIDANDRASCKFVLDIGNKGNLEYAENALGQNIAYAAEICARQHRHFAFPYHLLVLWLG